MSEQLHLRAVKLAARHRLPLVAMKITRAEYEALRREAMEAGEAMRAERLAEESIFPSRRLLNMGSRLYEERLLKAEIDGIACPGAKGGMLRLVVQP